MTISAKLAHKILSVYGNGPGTEFLNVLNAAGADGTGEFTTLTADGIVADSMATSAATPYVRFYEEEGVAYFTLAADGDTSWEVYADPATGGVLTETITCATGKYEKNLTDNLADAYTIKVNSGADLLTFTTTTGATAVVPVAGIGAAGGFTASPRNVHTGGVPAQISTEGTNLDIVVTELYVAELFIPCNMTITGAAVLWGTNTNGNAKICLFNSAGTRVAISASTDVSGFTGDSYGTRIAFSAAYAAKGPATYYLGVICDDNTNDINTHILGNFGAGKITGLVYATEAGYATITPPTTFTTGLGPIATLY